MKIIILILGIFLAVMLQPSYGVPQDASDFSYLVKGYRIGDFAPGMTELSDLRSQINGFISFISRFDIDESLLEISVHGMTDETGSVEANLLLARLRAEKCALELRKKLPNAKLEFQGLPYSGQGSINSRSCFITARVEKGTVITLRDVGTVLYNNEEILGKINGKLDTLAKMINYIKPSAKAISTEKEIADTPVWVYFAAALTVFMLIMASCSYIFYKQRKRRDADKTISEVQAEYNEDEYILCPDCRNMIMKKNMKRHKEKRCPVYLAHCSETEIPASIRP